MRKAIILLPATVAALAGILGACLVSIPEVTAPSCDASAGCDTGAGYDSADPCGHTTVPFGSFCGRSTQLGFDPSQADPNTLYYCVNGQVTDAQACVTGCFVAEANTPDRCNDGG